MEFHGILPESGTWNSMECHGGFSFLSWNSMEFHRVIFHVIFFMEFYGVFPCTFIENLFMEFGKKITVSMEFCLVY